ncbi:MAG: sulfur oxidation c-type cytochrome SoxX [Gammaproteobacteria bacterium]
MTHRFAFIAPAVLLGACLSEVASAEAPSKPAYQVQDFAIPTPLTSTPGDPARGRAVILERELGNCLACHAIPLDAEFPGSVGPPLAGIGARLSPAQLRLRVVDSKVLNPASVMPAYFRSSGLHRVQAEYVGQTILTAQQVEDVVAYLSTLK